MPHYTCVDGRYLVGGKMYNQSRYSYSNKYGHTGSYLIKGTIYMRYDSYYLTPHGWKYYGWVAPVYA